MSSAKQPLDNLVENLQQLVEGHRSDTGATLSSLLEGVRTVQASGADPRLRQLGEQVESIAEDLEMFAQLADQDLSRLPAAARAETQRAGKALELVTSLVGLKKPSLSQYCEHLLDGLMAANAAERGLVLFCQPDSSTGQVLTSRQFDDDNLNLEQNEFSHSVVKEVLKRKAGVFIDDAMNDPNFSEKTSIRIDRLRSILATPLMRHAEVIGVIYLENNSRPMAFDRIAQRLAQDLASFAAAHLYQVRLLPAAFERNKRITLRPTRCLPTIVTEDASMLDLLRQVEKVGESSAHVLLTGESGTGKELVAQAIHEVSPRKHDAFVTVNCPAISETLIESELFGHEKGSFTHAERRRIGKFMAANGGTIFLDEIGDMSPAMQAKVLRALNNKQVEPVGADRSVAVDVRVIAATNRNLEEDIAKGRFREDLYYRLKVVPLRLPSLRERRGDISLLIDHFLKEFCAIHQRKLTVETAIKSWLEEHPFPGNVRELRNLMERLVVLSEGEVIRLADLPKEYLDLDLAAVSLNHDDQRHRRLLLRMLRNPLKDLEDLECRQEELQAVFVELKHHLAQRTLEAQGSAPAAAEELGINRATLYKWLNRGKTNQV